MKRSHPSASSILQQVRLLRAQPAQAELARILDDLDAWRAVETALAGQPRLIAWGPKIMRGDRPVPWVSVVMWRRASGYSGYKTLTLSGVWAVQDTPPRIVVGQRRLPYAAPFYEAEAYHKLMRKEFTIYYRDDGAPPSLPSRRWDAPYVPEQRLALRETIRSHMLEMCE
ncbi:MAG: hypothetical protein IT320_15415 [Anaerolineae bacterium]|nr:hypothetical protein [Anaerolineae bacterium]